MKKAFLFTLLSSLLLTGCLSRPEEKVLTMSEIRAMDYGNYPKNYERTIQQSLYNTLIDPNSLMIDSLSKPRKFLRIEAGKSNLENVFYDLIIPKTGYLACVRFNAKNGYGGYVGWKVRAYIFNKAEQIQYISDDYLLCEQTGDVIIKKDVSAPVRIVD